MMALSPGPGRRPVSQLAPFSHGPPELLIQCTSPLTVTPGESSDVPSLTVVQPESLNAVAVTTTFPPTVNVPCGTETSWFVKMPVVSVSMQPDAPRYSATCDGVEESAR